RPLLPRLAAAGPVRAALLCAVIGRPGQVPVEAALLHADGRTGAAGFPAARGSFGSYPFGERPRPGPLAELTVTIAWGTRDVLLTHRTQARRARELFPFARHVDLPGCGHVPFSDDPGLCARMIMEEEA